MNVMAATRRIKPENTYYIGYNEEMAIEYIQFCTEWVRSLNILAQHAGEGIWDGNESNQPIKTYSLDFPTTNRRIVALSSRPTNLRGKQGTVVIDEGAFLMDLPAVLKAAMAMLVWGGKVRLISTHNGINHPFNLTIQEIRAGTRSGTVHRITFKEAVRQGLFKKICQKMQQPWSKAKEKAWVQEIYDYYGADAEEELDVIPSESQGDFLTAQIIEQCMDRTVPVVRLIREKEFTLHDTKDRQQNIQRWIREELDPALQSLHQFAATTIGADIGRSGHASSICILQTMEGMVRHTRLILEMWGIPFANQRQIFHHIIQKSPRLDRVHIDARGLGMEIAEAMGDSYGRKTVEGIMTADKWYREAMPQLKHAFEAKLITIPADPDIRQDLRDIEIIRGVPKISERAERRGINGKMRHSDSAISIAMAYAATTSGGLSYDYTPAPAELIEQFQGAW